MPPMLLVGLILLMGLVCGEIAVKFRLPKVTGYIIGGVLLNPGLFNFMPKDIIAHTSVITNVALSFITFSVGGTLLYSRVKKLGKGIIYITLYEAECAFLLVTVGVIAIAPFFIRDYYTSWCAMFIPLGLLLGALASPTDPSATLAVAHEYKAKGEVSSTIMGVAAFDDMTGIVNYSIAVVFAEAIVTHQHFSAFSSLIRPATVIIGSLALGCLFGLLFNLATGLIKKETEGFFIVVIFCLLTLCFGAATMTGMDELLATMTMGIIVVNFNPHREKIFHVLGRYTEELIFVLFFTISGMMLNFSVLGKYLVLVVFFALFRIAGKVAGTFIGATLAGTSDKIRRYTAGGLIPQGGIVIGLALMIKQNKAFGDISDIVVSLIIGATIIHELIGPIFAEIALKKAGEIKR